ncbi:hypothetical protein LIER_22226 [Lithospermum erythrorhizon]|uniref:Uncharacterized protein n=1 Tax=Lithospermum erythrorhizon TaxID=34254 RepID=A0AAV3QVL0_LITER
MSDDHSEENPNAVQQQEARPAETSATNAKPPRPGLPVKEVNHEIANRARAVETEDDDDILVIDPYLGGEALLQPLAMIPPTSSSSNPSLSNVVPPPTEDS